MASVEDRWIKTNKDGEKVRSDRYGKGMRYRVHYRVIEDGKVVQKSELFPDKKKRAADQLANEINASKGRGLPINPRAGARLFGEFAEQWLAAQTFDASTRAAVESRLRVHILPTFGGKRLDRISAEPSAIQAWLRGRQHQCAPSYVRVLLANLSAILTAAVADGLIPANPCSSPAVKAPRVDRSKIIPWTRDQVDAVVAAHPDRYSTIPFVTAGLGLRQGEVFGLDLDAVDWLRQRVLVRQQIKLIGGHLVFAPPKGGRDRYVPLPDVVGVALSEHIRSWEPVVVTLPWKDLDGPLHTSTLFFTSRESKPINRNHYNPYIWKPALEKAGIAPIRANGMHALRHYYASATLSGGVSIRALADYLGHTDPGFTLRIYAHLMPDDEDRARAVVDAALGPRGVALNSGVSPVFPEESQNA